MTPEPDESLQAAFQLSWDAVEEFYRDDLLKYEHWQWLRPLLVLVAALRAAGYDRVLRAGQSMYKLVLSRSRKHGLRKGQPSVVVQPYPDGTMEIIVDDGHASRVVQPSPDGTMRIVVIGGAGFQSQKVPEIVLCRELIDALDNLRRQPID
jgi:hypothetical protein